MAGVRVVAIILERLGIGDHHDRRGGVPGQYIAFHQHLVVGHDQDARAAPYARHDIARGCEIGGVIGNHKVAPDDDIAATHHGQAGQIENENSAGVSGGEIVFDQRIAAVLYLDPGDIGFGDGVADGDAVGLADIDARIASARYLAAVDQDIGAFHRIDAIGAVVRIGPLGPGDADAVIDDVVRTLGLDPVALRVLHRETGQGHLVAGDEQPLARTLLSGEVEHRTVHSRTLHRDPIDIEAEAFRQGIATRGKLHRVARLGQDQRFLQPLLRIIAGGNGMGGGNQRRGCAKQRGKETLADHRSLPSSIGFRAVFYNALCRFLSDYRALFSNSRSAIRRRRPRAIAAFGPGDVDAVDAVQELKRETRLPPSAGMRDGRPNGSGAARAKPPDPGRWQIASM